MSTGKTMDRECNKGVGLRMQTLLHGDKKGTNRAEVVMRGELSKMVFEV